MKRMQSRPSARGRSTLGGRRRVRARLHLVLLAMIPLLASPLLWAWNPYETDSHGSSAYSSADRASPGDYRTPRPPEWGRTDPGRQGSDWPGALDSRSQWYLSEDPQDATWSSAPRDDFDAGGRGAADQRWQSGAPTSDWSDQSRWREAPSERSDAWRQPSQGRYWNDTVGGRSDDRSLHERRDHWPQDAASDWDVRGQQRFRDSGGDRLYSSGGYQFRPDPDLQALRPGGPAGWEFRPLSERDNARSPADSPYPQIDERDYLPRGPWRSYQDEGVTFGYHADDEWSGYSSQPPLR
ncbi:MAG: hypothetical protein K9L82_12420 [Chromatiaceae bacterium]|nr:hypothetical protein [Chromatiaceae bacterium]